MSPLFETRDMTTNPARVGSSSRGKTFNSTWRARALQRLSLLAIGCVLSGCAGDDGTVPVSGVLKLSTGEPLGGGKLLFYSNDGTVTTGVAQSDGSFVIQQSVESDGLPPGEYTVVIKSPPPVDIDAPPLAPKFHQKYGGRMTTDLRVTVAADAPLLDIVLDPPQ